MRILVSWKYFTAALSSSYSCSTAIIKIIPRSEEHTSELQSRPHLVCRLLLEKKNHVSRVTPPGRPIVLAFSGGLDTSFCIPYLQERGWAVHTVFAYTGGGDADGRAYIQGRAA